MNLSRSEGKRNIPSLSLARWFIVLTGFFVFVAVSFFLYVRSADSEYRNSETNAIRIAKEQGGLTEIDEAVTHTWNETVWVVSGKDADGENWMIFERVDEIVRKKLSENMSEKQMLAKFSEEHNGTPIRIIPGWFNGGPVWEIRYWNENSNEYQSLDFYSFENGSMLKTYVLSS
ncbi:DUF5590 domain-containing protein [Cohnella luojiensis]|uniref:Cell wall elongation regulator TseB-like domain-containing protein n=1 Tax=Cohnella luojiensis TaxID=652876 RepID=A0A4Y8M683_9BACL|nr:DUF5590 domain-containing protein [Cohnella luojiensis]TFE30040.1 hypothetical protein E2980_04610 [Cohnella luojiensis]